jgi:hypothetical protein
MSRIAELQREDLDADGQQLYDEILAARGSIAGRLESGCTVLNSRAGRLNSGSFCVITPVSRRDSANLSS